MTNTHLSFDLQPPLTALCASLCAILLLASACSDDEPVQTSASSSSSSAVGGSGSGAGGSAAGGSGGMAVGGSGGAAPSCLDASEHTDVFSIDDPTLLCVVAKYSAPFAMGYSIVPTWGRHGGPLTMTQSTTPNDAITLTRWAVPSSTQGALTIDSTTGPVDLMINQANLFMNPAAVDLPFDSYTFVGWSEFGSSNGEAILLSGTTVGSRHAVAGLFTGVGVADGNGGRLIHHSVTGLDDANATPSVGLYATDFASATPTGPSLPLVSDGNASGVVAVDQDGTVLSTFVDLAADTQTARGFAASTIAPTSVATSGDVLFTIPGSGTALAATAPDGNHPGLLLLQTFDSTTFMSEDILVQPYTVAGDTVAAVGTPTTALSMTVPGTVANLLRDDLGRIWVAVDSDVAESTFFVLQRRP